MCIDPKIVKRSYAGRDKFYTVPCGKCHECISKKQHEFAALGVLEAKRSSSMYMVAFTFKNSACPIMYSLDTSGGVDLRLVDDPLERNRILPFMKRIRYKDGKRIEYLVRYEVSDSSRYVPSLDRELMRLFVKKVRVQYKRLFGSPLCFTYAAFGEYGDEFKRPHFHFLIYNLTDSQMDFVKKYWEREFGWCDVKKIPVLNKDGSPARVKTSLYVSKYVSKDKSDYDALLKGWVESPRRFSSLHFGQGVLPQEQLNSFYLCEDIDPRNRFDEILKRKKSLVIDGKKFPLPRSISKQIFYDCFIHPIGGVSLRSFDFCDGNASRFVEEGRSVRTDGVYKFIRLPSCVKTKRIYRRSTLSCMVGEYARVRYLEDFARKLRQDSEALSNSLDRERIKKVLSDESSLLEIRVQTAKKYYLNALKKQKYG